MTRVGSRRGDAWLGTNQAAATQPADTSPATTRPLTVELVDHAGGTRSTGIGRYTADLVAHLGPHISVRPAQFIVPPGPLAPLRHFQLGLSGHQPGAIVHFTQIVGCSQMLWRPVHPAVGTVHDLGMLVWPPEAAIFRPIDRLILRLSYAALKRLDAIIAISESTRRSVIERLGMAPGRVFRVYPGIDCNHFRAVPAARQQLRARYPLPGDDADRYLLYVGSELPRKNLATLLRALRLLPPSVRLIKVGSAGGARFRQATQRLIAELGLGDRVAIVDGVPEADLPLFYSSADCYVCASRLEGFCLPVLEAMACGVPLVCANATALPEVAGDAARYAVPDDAPGFAAAIETILAQPGLAAALAARGRERARTFTWDRAAREAERVYAHVAAEHAGGRRVQPARPAAGRGGAAGAEQS